MLGLARAETAQIGVPDPPQIGRVISIQPNHLPFPKAQVSVGGRTVGVELTLPGARPGDLVELSGTRQPDGSTVYLVSDFERRPALIALTVLFVAVAFAVGRGKGLRAVAGMGFSLAVILLGVIPAILAGWNPLGVALCGSLSILVLSVTFVHGLNWTSGAALLGTFAACGVTLGLATLSADVTHLSGVGNETTLFLQNLGIQLDFRALLLAGITIGALGAIVDATVPQAAVVRELAHHQPDLKWGALYRSAMRVGLDHIGSLINTLVLAYAGTSLPLLVLLYAGAVPWAEAVNAETLAAVVVQTLVGSTGLVLAVPLTSLIAALAFQGGRLPAPGAGERRVH